MYVTEQDKKLNRIRVKRVKAHPVDLDAFEKMIQNYLIDHGLVDPTDSNPGEYEARNIRDIVRDQVIRKVEVDFQESTMVHVSESDSKALKNFSTEQEMVAYLYKQYPDLKQTVLKQVVDGLRLEFFGLNSAKAQGMTPAQFAEATTNLHKKHLVGNTYGGSSALFRLEQWITGKYDIPGSWVSIERINEVCKGFTIRTFKNGRLDIFFKDEKKKNELMAFLADYAAKRYKNWLE